MPARLSSSSILAKAPLRLSKAWSQVLVPVAMAAGFPGSTTSSTLVGSPGVGTSVVRAAGRGRGRRRRRVGAVGDGACRSAAGPEASLGSTTGAGSGRRHERVDRRGGGVWATERPGLSAATRQRTLKRSRIGASHTNQPASIATHHRGVSVRSRGRHRGANAASNDCAAAGLRRRVASPLAIARILGHIRRHERPCEQPFPEDERSRQRDHRARPARLVDPRQRRRRRAPSRPIRARVSTN